MKGSDRQNLTEFVRELVRIEFAKRDVTRKGGNTLISSESDIHLVTKGTHKVYQNGTEIGYGVSSDGKVWLNSAHTAWLFVNSSGTLEIHVSGGIQEVPV